MTTAYGFATFLQTPYSSSNAHTHSNLSSTNRSNLSLMHHSNHIEHLEINRKPPCSLRSLWGLIKRFTNEDDDAPSHLFLHHLPRKIYSALHDHIHDLLVISIKIKDWCIVIICNWNLPSKTRLPGAWQRSALVMAGLFA